jgi:hypothetical protein
MTPPVATMQDVRPFRVALSGAKTTTGTELELRALPQPETLRILDPNRRQLGDAAQGTSRAPLVTPSTIAFGSEVARRVVYVEFIYPVVGDEVASEHRRVWIQLATTPTSAWEPALAELRARLESIIAAHLQPPGPKQALEPSRRAQLIMQRAQAAAVTEVRSHLDAGRMVYGRRDGTPVVVEPKK